MAKKKRQSGHTPAPRSHSDQYYEQENRRTGDSGKDRVRFYSYDDQPRPAHPRPAAASGAKRRGKKRKKGGRYRLAHPEKLLLMVGFLIVLILLLVIFIRSKKGGAETPPESQEPVKVVQNQDQSQITGTVKSVSNTDLTGIPNQLAAYMAGMMDTNPDNYKKDPDAQSPQTPVDQQPQGNFAFAVAIDPGHGGSDVGYEGGQAEKDINLKMAEKVQAYISQHAPEYHAFLLRTNDAVLGDQQRLTKAEQGSAGLIVSLHCNGSDLELGGTSAAYWTGDGDDETRMQQSKELAEELMTAAADGFGMWERESRVEDTPLLHTSIPSVMLEMGYLTYEFDNRLLTDEALQDAAAEKIGQVMIDFMKEVAPVDGQDSGADSVQSAEE